jgi:hypothetical protein
MKPPSGSRKPDKLNVGDESRLVLVWRANRAADELAAKEAAFKEQQDLLRRVEENPFFTLKSLHYDTVKGQVIVKGTKIDSTKPLTAETAAIHVVGAQVIRSLSVARRKQLKAFPPTALENVMFESESSL